MADTSVERRYAERNARRLWVEELDTNQLRLLPGHATVDVTQNVYNRTWWEERVEAVSLAAANVWREFTPGQQ